MKYITTFPRLLRCPKLVILLENGEFVLVEKMGDEDRTISYAIRGSSSHFYLSKEDYETFKQQWMSVLIQQCHIPRLIWCPKFVILLEIGEFFFNRKDTVLTIRTSGILSEAHKVILYISKKG